MIDEFLMRQVRISLVQLVLNDLLLDASPYRIQVFCSASEELCFELVFLSSIIGWGEIKERPTSTRELRVTA